MRFAATDLVVMTLKVFEFPIQKRGFEILFPRDTLLVDTPCSGIRSLIAFLALGALFAYFLTGSKKMKIFLFLMALPVSFLSNYLRILFLSLIAYVYGAKIATETFLHDFSGVMVFVVGFIFFKFLWGLLSGKI